jgi:ABC-2 type transport system permease protein
MATKVATKPAPAPTPAHRRPAALHAERADARLALRQIWFGAVIVAASAGVLFWLGKTAFDKTQHSAGGGLMLGLADNPAYRALYGLPTAINTVGGFTVWRVQTFVMLIGTVWIILATTRVLRGNEETGRLDLVLANPLSLTGATVSSLLALAGIPVLTGVVTGAVLQGLGAPAAGSWLYAAGICLLLATFLALSALTAQLVPERRRAAGIAGAVLFGLFLVRMYADGAKSGAWARWATPFGWVEQLHAFGGNDLLPLLPLIATPVVLIAVAMVLLRRRDADAGVFRAADSKQNASTRLLSRPLAFATRRRLGEVLAWGVGVALLGVMWGGLSHSLVGLARTQPQTAKTLQQAGLGVILTPTGFIAVMDVFTAVVLALYALTCIHGDYDDEINARLDLPYSNRVTRTNWAGSTLMTGAVALVALTALLGFFTWAGSEWASAGVSVGDSFSAAANVLPVVAVFLGLAMLLHGVLPSWTAGVIGALAVGLYMVELIGPALRWSHWLLDLSPYHHLALVPTASPAWAALGIMIGIGVAASAAGLFGYAHRDLR